MDRLATAAPALIFGAVVIISAAWAITYSVRGGEHRTRSGIRRLENLANHPGARALLDNIRKEK
ncbi:hypothetical protein [Streptomyces sp. AHA2]|uniref:hypothetical protein n=1 Tax=Streptomyces sp. AHA2 TaxID=3064526 RepID=UPI002FE0A92F